MANRSKRPSVRLCETALCWPGRLSRPGVSPLSASVRAARKPRGIAELSTQCVLLKTARTLVKSTDLGKWQPFLKLHLNSLRTNETRQPKRRLEIQTFIQKHSRNAQEMFSVLQCPVLAKLLNRENRFQICICKQDARRSQIQRPDSN